MNDINNTAKTIIDAIRPLAEKLGDGAAHLYQVYVRQMYVEAIASLLVLAVVLVVGAYTLARLRKTYNNGDDISRGNAAFFAAVTTVALVFSFAFIFTKNFPKILNPEYYAVQRIVDQVKGKD